MELLDCNLLVLFVLTSAALTLFPGPDIMYVFTTSLTKGWRSGAKVSLGLTTGLWVHTLLVVLGVGNLLQKYPEFLRPIEVMGGCYLLYLAVKLWRAEKNKLQKRKGTTQSKSENYYITGLIMNLSNPKVSLFFVSFFPGFLFHQSWSYQFQFLILGLLFYLQALLLFFMVSFFAGQLGKKMVLNQDNSKWDKFQAIVLLLIALLLFYP